ncbi:MAG: UPF0280 family protein [Desulfovibrionaceae bacterium]|nr:UPF0280 family protein [Desulfovibrionaceae bacterium]MBF0514275.1 UPF0280 family protein [Desulfovibrionaceae bacterium]
MDVFTGVHREYRQRTRPGPGETGFQCVVEQTDLWIVARRDVGLEVARFVAELRAGLKNYLILHPQFQKSLVPVAAQPGAPPIALAMAEAATACGVGPMAAVAGAVAQFVAERFVPQSPDFLVENGGDTFLCSTRERVIGLLAKPLEGVSLGLRLAPRDFPVSLCASSATIGPSLSFGAADVVVVRAKNGALADAAATALGNLIKSPQHLKPAVDAAQAMRPLGVEGFFAQCGDRIAVCGKMELVALE